MTHGNICMKTNRYSPCIHVDDGSTTHNPLYKVIRISKNVGVLHIFLQRHITKTHVRGLFACDYHQTSTVWRFKPATVPSGKISTSGKNPSMTAFAFSTEELPCTAFFIVSTPNWARRLNNIEEKRRIILVPTK